jgi:hypothetical protein
MKCPDCGKRLTAIPPCKGEWACLNDDCPANKIKQVGNVHSEYYGILQETIDKQKHVTVVPKEMEVKK